MAHVLLAQQIIYERPESELGRGKYSTSPWVVGTLVALAVLFALAFVIVVARRRAKRAADDVGPISSRGSVRPGPPSSRSKS
ncbi:MAG: hypothetical protein HOV80_12015 [Polyangiaceae bacterium]|nr:hypothetical protein [Polyangiaceae bacterium]